jgi:retron-type reverse transcriptase
MHIAFIDLEKAFDRINRSKLWEILDKRGHPKYLINFLINMYNETKIKIELGDGRLSQEIFTNKGVRQGCSLSPLLCNIYIYIYR